MDEITVGESFVHYCYDHEHGGNVKEMEHCEDCNSHIRRLTFNKIYDVDDLYQVLVEDRQIQGCFEDCSRQRVIPVSSFMLKVVTDEFSVTDEEMSAFEPHMEVLLYLFGIKDRLVTLKASIGRDKVMASQLDKGKNSKKNKSSTGFDTNGYTKVVSQLRSDIVNGVITVCKCYNKSSPNKFILGLAGMLADIIIMSEIQPLLVTDSPDDKKANPHVKSRDKASS